MGSRVAVDIGGTFTDVVGFRDTDHSLVIGKTLSTPDDLIRGIIRGLDSADIAMTSVDSIVHGSTVVINALIERKGARAAIITTRGFRDVYEIGRVNRPDAFNLAFEKHRPLIPREHILEVDERIRADGRIESPLDTEQLEQIAVTLEQIGVEAVGVVLLHSYRNPEHERKIGGILRRLLPHVYVTLSHELSREYREFERTSTTAANAFVGPTVSAYLTRLQDRLDEVGTAASLSIMQSNGGISDVETVRQQSVQMMESGPAGGVVGTIELCKTLGYQDAIAFDMGGTTAKAAVIREQSFPLAAEYFVGGYVRGLPIRIPCLDIVEVGTGGGSVAWVDDAGGLHVGPHSAGAVPGPACYGQGGSDATVTDAAVTLGLLSSDRSLSGNLALDAGAANAAVEGVAAKVDLSVPDAAVGVLAIAAASMANAVRAVTTERGLDPRDFALFAFGGNGPLHVSLVARELGIRDVVIPPAPAVFSALGMLMADIRYDLVLTEIRPLSQTPAEVIEQDFTALEDTGRRWLDASGYPDTEITFARMADMRYIGQEHFLTVTMPERLADAGIGAVKDEFDRVHRERFSHAAPDEDAEIVTLRLSVIGAVARPKWTKIAVGTATCEKQARRGSRLITLGDGAEPVPCDVYERSDLRAGNQIDGPAVIEEGTTTTLLRDGDRLRVDPLGNLLIQIGEH